MKIDITLDNNNSCLGCPLFRSEDVGTIENDGWHYFVCSCNRKYFKPFITTGDLEDRPHQCIEENGV